MRVVRGALFRFVGCSGELSPRSRSRSSAASRPALPSRPRADRGARARRESLCSFASCAPVEADGADDGEGEGAACPPNEPDCDRLDGPCIEEERASTGFEAPAASPQGLTPAKTKSGKHRIWSNGRVPYEIASSVSSKTKKLLLKAMDAWQTKSKERVRLEPAKKSDTAYVLVTEGSPAVSHVGYAVPVRHAKHPFSSTTGPAICPRS